MNKRGRCYQFARIVDIEKFIGMSTGTISRRADDGRIFEAASGGKCRVVKMENAEILVWNLERYSSIEETVLCAEFKEWILKVKKILENKASIGQV